MCYILYVFLALVIHLGFYFQVFRTGRLLSFLPQRIKFERKLAQKNVDDSDWMIGLIWLMSNNFCYWGPSLCPVEIHLVADVT